MLIPPSVTMILYGGATETSIGKCFIAGVIPGILLVVLSSAWLGVVFFYRKIVPARIGLFSGNRRGSRKILLDRPVSVAFQGAAVCAEHRRHHDRQPGNRAGAPPVGVNLYVVKNIAPDVPMSQVLLGVIPFGIIDLPVIVLMFIWPEWAIWLPNKMIG
jgi:TRAP-type C4-dicarboxylate transport system permease large subunit